MNVGRLRFASARPRRIQQAEQGQPQPATTRELTIRTT
jgi:hypothetical protein